MRLAFNSFTFDLMKTSIFLISLFFCTPVFAQKKIIQKLISNEHDTARNSSFLPLPTFGYSQERGAEFGVGAIYSYYMDRNDTLNRSSNFILNASYSTKGIYNLNLKGDLWTKSNDYHILGDLRFKEIPFNFYGIGNNTFETNADKLVQSFFRGAAEVEKKISPNFYTGVSIGVEKYSFKDEEVGGIYDLNNYTSKKGGTVGFFGVSQSFDTRNSNNYPTKGFYGRISIQYLPNIDSKLDYNGVITKINLRNFSAITNKLILGIQGYFHNVGGKNTPFFLLPQLGNDELMRGYYTGRYRDKNLAAFQAEIRYRYNSRFGLVAFAGTGNVYGIDHFKLSNLKPNYGGGLRYFFDPEKGLSIRVDYGIGEKLPKEKRQSGLYISLAEAF